MADRIVTIGASGKMYTQPLAAVQGEADFQPGEDNIVFVFDDGAYQRFYVLASSYTTTSDHRLIFKSATGKPDLLTRGSGVRIIGSSNSAFKAFLPYCELYGMKFSTTGTSTANGIQFDNGGYNCLAKNCISYDCHNSGFYAAFGCNGSKFINCLSFGNEDGFINYATSTDIYFYNCVALNNTTTGFFTVTDARSTIKNSYSGGNGTGYDNSGTITLTTSFSSDGSESTSIKTIASCNFIISTAGSENLEIQTGSSLLSYGTDLQSDAIYNLTDDILGTARQSVPCVGAFEYVASSTVINNSFGSGFSGWGCKKRGWF